MPSMTAVTKHYGYGRLMFPWYIAYTVYHANRTCNYVYSTLRPVAVVLSEAEAISRCKCLELENYGKTK